MAATGVIVPSNLTGSWYSTGFHGHFRAKSRNDIYCEYRQLAKPQPPRAFLTRLKDSPLRHVFSKHDNRFSFTTDATYLDLGVGKKRKAPNAAALHGQKDLISWVPALVPPSVPPTDDYRPPPLSGGFVPPNVSLYRSSFNPRNEMPPQILTRRPKSSFDEDADPGSTTYRLTFGGYDPNKEMISALNHETLITRTPSVRTQPRSVAGSAVDSLTGRSSVANCMTWHVHTPSPPSDHRSTHSIRRPRLCEATPTMPPQLQQAAIATEAEHSNSGQQE